MKLLVAAVGLLALCVHPNAASNSTEWCYHDPACNDTTWPTLFPSFCNGNRQSPININSSDTTVNDNLTEIMITNSSVNGFLDKIENTGRTIKVKFRKGIEFHGGDLTESYEALQFHLHWGNRTSVPGSEHTVNGIRYPGEMHIVTIKKSLNGNTSLGTTISDGFAAFGFFIEESTSSSALSNSWRTLLNDLSNISFCDTSIAAPSGVSLDDLIQGVNLSSYYRYLGSLTTPNCFESVVWTVFKEPIGLSSDVIDLFSTLYIGANASSPLMINVYRGIQDLALTVTTQREATESSASMIFYSLGLIALSLFVSWS